jgi:peptide/nickel transport system permease protein
VIAGNNATSEDIANIRAHMGLDKPIAVQYVLWLGQVLQGDLGYSYYLSKPVTALVAQRVEPTLALALGTVLLAVCIAVPLGSLAAWRMGGWLDRGLSAFSVAGFSVPVFVIAYLLIYVFAMQLQWLPVQGYKPISGPQSQGTWAWMRQLILPWLTLSTVYVALIARITRASVSEALQEDFIRTARAKGLSEFTLLVKYPMRLALNPFISTIAWLLPNLVSGSIIVAIVMSLPTAGPLLLQSLMSQDMYLAGAFILLICALTVVGSLISDILLALVDPRIRLE